VTANRQASVTAICIRPIGTDLVAASAFDTLVRKMGYNGILASLSREEAWILSLDCDTANAARVTRMLAENTGIFVNPNTHRHTIVSAEEALPFGSAGGRGDVCVVVWSYDDSQVRPTEVAVRDRVGVRELVCLRKMTFWWPGFVESGLEGKNPGDVARSMAVTHSRREGLLSNPHYQGLHVVEGPLTPAELSGAVEKIGRAQIIQ